jgi:hypothetical protein
LFSTAQAITPLPTRPDLCMVEHTVYQPQVVQKDQRHLPSIGFTVLEEGRKLEGINLEDALNQRYSHLDGRDDPMFEDESVGNSISCRMEVCKHSHNGFNRFSIPSQLVRFISSWDTVCLGTRRDRYGYHVSPRFGLGLMQQTDRDKKLQEDTRPNYEAEIGARCR